MPRKAAGTAAGRDGSTVGKVVVDGVTTGAGGEVRRRGHQPRQGSSVLRQPAKELRSRAKGRRPARGVGQCGSGRLLLQAAGARWCPPVLVASSPLPTDIHNSRSP